MTQSDSFKFQEIVWQNRKTKIALNNKDTIDSVKENAIEILEKTKKKIIKINSYWNHNLNGC